MTTILQRNSFLLFAFLKLSPKTIEERGPIVKLTSKQAPNRNGSRFEKKSSPHDMGAIQARPIGKVSLCGVTVMAMGFPLLEGHRQS